MASATVPRDFDGTCVLTRYPCDVGHRYIDPCNCTSFFLCATDTEIIRQSCPGGTGFNNSAGPCIKLSDLVFGDLCDINKPWDRCSDESKGVDVYALEERCTGVRPTPPPSPEEGVDGGLIAGVVIAVLVAIILVVVLIIYFRKKGNPIQHFRSAIRKDGGQGSSQPSASRYGGGPGDEETYAEIDDTAVYKDPSGGKKLTHSMSHTNETYDRDAEEGVAYDNPALQRDTPPTPGRNPHPVPGEYSSLDVKEQVARSYSSLNEHTAAAAVSSDRNSKEPTTGDDGYLVAEAIGESHRNSSPVDPSYFVLEKS